MLRGQLKMCRPGAESPARQAQGPIEVKEAIELAGVIEPSVVNRAMQEPTSK